MKIVLIIPVLLICTGVTASEYRSDFPVFLQDTIIHTDSLTFTGKEEALKRKARKRDNENAEFRQQSSPLHLPPAPAYTLQ